MSTCRNHLRLHALFSGRSSFDHHLSCLLIVLGLGLDGDLVGLDGGLAGLDGGFEWRLGNILQQNNKQSLTTC